MANTPPNPEEFISLAAHQLRTPLSIISMYSELLQRESTSGKHNEEECFEYANEIQKATKRMADIINDLLNVSRNEHEKT